MQIYREQRSAIREIGNQKTTAVIRPTIESEQEIQFGTKVHIDFYKKLAYNDP